MSGNRRSTKCSNIASRPRDSMPWRIVPRHWAGLSRPCKDWHALLELCAIYRTLLGDADGLYDPSQYNDRLLLGLKGTMSEAELHILKSRLQQGMWNKAARGEVLNHAPIGYVRTIAGDF